MRFKVIIVWYKITIARILDICENKVAIVRNKVIFKRKLLCEFIKYFCEIESEIVRYKRTIAKIFTFAKTA